jgi:hypothetical protein
LTWLKPSADRGGNPSYGSGSRLTFGSGSDRRKWTSAIKRAEYDVTERMKLEVGPGRAAKRKILFQDCSGLSFCVA